MTQAPQRLLSPPSAHRSVARGVSRGEGVESREEAAGVDADVGVESVLPSVAGLMDFLEWFGVPSRHLGRRVRSPPKIPRRFQTRPGNCYQFGQAGGLSLRGDDQYPGARAGWRGKIDFSDCLAHRCPRGC